MGAGWEQRMGNWEMISGGMSMNTKGDGSWMQVDQTIRVLEALRESLRREEM